MKTTKVAQEPAKKIEVEFDSNQKAWQQAGQAAAAAHPRRTYEADFWIGNSFHVRLSWTEKEW